MLPRYNNAKYYISVRGDIFGLEDAIYTKQLLHDELDIYKILVMMGKRKFYGERRFSTMSINMVEALTLNVTELMKISNEFPRTCEFIYREQSELLGEIVRARLHYIDKMKNQERLEMHGRRSPNEMLAAPMLR